VLYLEMILEKSLLIRMAHALHHSDAGNCLTVAVGLHLQVRAAHESTPLCADHDDMLLNFPRL
jgi:hypothetical protein